MDDRFTIVGIRPVPLPRRRTPRWHEGKPVASMAVLAVILAGCLLCDLFIPRDPAYMDLYNASRAPCREFWFGTDAMGRDIFSMIWHGGRISLFIGFFAAAVSTLIAIVVGAASGLAPKWLDELLMRLTEIFLSIPSLLLIVLIQAVLGSASVFSISLVIGLTSWTSIAKVVRAEVRQLRSSEYVVAARCMGAGFPRILRRHLAPNFLSSIMFMAVMNIPRRHQRRVHPQLHGHRPASGGDLLGQYAEPVGKRAVLRGLVDHPDPRRLSGGHAAVRDQYRQLPPPPVQPEGEQSVKAAEGRLFPCGKEPPF